MPRRYAITFEQVSVTGAQDLTLIKGGTGKILRILRVWVGSVSVANPAIAPTSQSLSIRCRTLPTTVTNGTGGSAATPIPFDPGDTAATFTARVNDTVKATTSGTAVTNYENGAHIYSGDDHVFPNPPIVGSTSAFVFEMLSIPNGTVNLSGGVEVEEIG